MVFSYSPLWTTLQNVRRDDSSGEIFRVTHPFHPCRGCEFSLESVACQRGGEQISLSDPDGYPIWIPIRFTDASPPDPYIEIGQGRSFFRVQDLVKLTEVVRALKKGKGKHSRKTQK
jgi:hypothetical protein